jgi:hypothetical protein
VTTVAVDPCPHCGTTSGVQPMPAPPKVQAWKCTCGMDWAISMMRPALARGCAADRPWCGGAGDPADALDAAAGGRAG